MQITRRMGTLALPIYFLSLIMKLQSSALFMFYFYPRNYHIDRSNANEALWVLFYVYYSKANPEFFKRHIDNPPNTYDGHFLVK